MKVAFNARLLSSPTLRGWNRYTVNLLLELSSLHIKLFLYSDQPLHKSHLAKLPKDSYQIRIAPVMPYVYWEQYWLPKQCEKDKVDILHCPINFGLPWSSPCPRILTLHDVIDQVYSCQDRPWYKQFSLANIQTKAYHWVARNKAEHIITVSQHSKQDIIKYLQIPEGKITVIYEAASSGFEQALIKVERLRVRSKYQLQLPYIFYVGGWEERKNIPFLINAFAQANLDNVDLVLAGGKDEQHDTLSELGKSLGIADRLKLLGWVNDADIPALYAEALCFVYPSKYEGFGLQLCEAMVVGCPVFAAKATCLPEVLGDGGETFSIYEIKELVNLLKRLTGDKSYYDHLVNQAKNRSQHFNWQITARQTEQVYKQLL
ncbi:MAG: glycosyltransferase family 1 protein [Nostoc sp.]|uniref:glycosyltransferase family 4 protein n=1 Tax=Nostoc sp. TaxID=1180 RepID=UPI002FFB3327